jgi:hypothetical protein
MNDDGRLERSFWRRHAGDDLTFLKTHLDTT